MSLNSAHEGYEYQDLLAAYFILIEIIEGKESEVFIDVKAVESDKFDDLTISNSNGIFKKQIKYSGSSSHTLGKQDLSSKSYDLALDILFNSWSKLKDDNLKEIRLCLSWNEPVDDVLEVLCKLENTNPSFTDINTNLYKINGAILWPEHAAPMASWKRFKKQSSDIDRNEFLIFCEQLIIEVNFPKFSKDVHQPGILENIVLQQLENLGIGEFPNEHLNSTDTLLNLTHKIKQSRANGTSITISNILSYLRITTDFGAIEQTFPISEEYNVTNPQVLNDYLNRITELKKVLLTAPPGAGKSWFITNLQKIAKENDIRIIKHYCYTDIQDSLQKNRITINTFCGNLVAELIHEFPELTEFKQKKYSSTLSELNYLLQHIPEKTILIVDGLDHINRVYEMLGQTLSKAEVDIINKIQSITLGDNVSCIISSQPISELDTIHDFQKLELPLWGIPEVLELFHKNNLRDLVIDNKNNLSSLLLEKSEGNLLYLSYLIRELIKQHHIDSDAINELPTYSNNLSNYYEYILSKIDHFTDVPRVLSGCSFRLKTEELKEITQFGDRVEQQLELMSPILKSSVIQGGHIIYHESFRRFIIEKLQGENLNVKKLIFQPIIDWLSTKDFYSFQKAYRFYFPLLIENDGLGVIGSHIDSDFLSKSTFHGQPLTIIRHNLEYMLQAALNLRSFPLIITLHELSRTIDSTRHEFYDEYEYYINAFGHLNGFERVNQSLVFEAKPTLDVTLGLKTCYNISKQGEMPPWEMYSRAFDKGNEITIADFGSYLRFIIDLKENAELIHIGNWIIEDVEKVFGEIFVNEVGNQEDSEIQQICYKIKVLIEKPDEFDIIKCANALTTGKYPQKKDVKSAEDLIFLVRRLIQNNELAVVEEIQKMFNGNFWFHNWILYCIRLEIIIQNPLLLNSDQFKLCFDLLLQNTELYKGSPKITDLYTFGNVIHKSLVKGLSILKSESDWKMAIDSLHSLNLRTCFYMQNDEIGPLNTLRLFDILSEHCPLEYSNYLIEVFTQILEKIESNHFHSSIARCYFIVSILNSKIENKATAEEQFQKGVSFLLGYTFRKDTTIEELIDPLVSINRLNPEIALKDLLEIKNLVDSVVQHTDGKGTKHFPISWFSKFIEISLPKSLLYLFNEISKVQYHWILEANLKDLLVFLGGQYPVEEFHLSRTFPTDYDEEFIAYRLNLFLKIPEYLTSLAHVEIHHIHELITNNTGEGYSNELLELFQKVMSRFQITDELKATPKKVNERDPFDRKNGSINLFLDNFSFRPQLDEMDEAEVAEYIEEFGIREWEKLSFYHYYLSKSELTEEIKFQIKGIVEKRRFYKEEDQEQRIIEDLFEEGSDLYICYWLYRFSYEIGGYFENFVNVDAFQKAYSSDKSLCMDLLFEVLHNKLKNQSYHRNIPANLISTLEQCNVDPNMIMDMWAKLKDSITSRLPVVAEDNWDEILSNPLEMSQQDLLLSILISRFQNGSMLRYQKTISSIESLLKYTPETMVKPLTWFFKNSTEFLSTTHSIILQLLLKYPNMVLIESPDFKNSITENHPKRHFCIDFIASKLYPELKLSSIITNPTNTFMERDEYLSFLDLNYRYGVLSRMGLDLRSSFSQQRKILNENRKNDMTIFWNNSYSLMVPNIYSTDYLERSLNECLYTDIQDQINYENEEIFDVLKPELAFVVSYHKSLIHRPHIPKPASEPNNYGLICQPISDSNGWIRIGYFEDEDVTGFTESERSQHRILGAISFEKIEGRVPYSDYISYPKILYKDENEFDIEPRVIFSLINKPASLEEFSLLWLNPSILNQLEIHFPTEYDPLVCLNNLNEPVLKFEHWQSNFRGTYIGGIEDEFATLEGSQLMMRKDYFEKMCELFDEPPRYYEYHVHHFNPKSKTK